MSSLKYWVWLAAMTDLKPSTRYELISAFDDPEAAYHADEQSLLEKVRLTDGERRTIADKSLAEADKILSVCHEEGISIITVKDAIYPERLRNIYDPPVVLFVKGRLPVMDEHAAIGVVGTRKATPYGIKMARSFGFEITRGGGLLVTGLAEGIDSASAEGALRAGGSCIGVLGCAIDKVYPVFNEPLYKDVAAVGAVVSEYPPGTEGSGRFFPERNRIISGLSVGVTVIEAPIKSGSLITARLALEQGREVFAVPGNADMSSFSGSNSLIHDHSAQLVVNGGQVLSEFRQRFPERLAQNEEKHFSRFDGENVPPAYSAAAPSKSEKTEKTSKIGAGFAKLRIPTARKNVDKPKKREYIDLREQLTGLSETQLQIISAMDEDSKHIDDIIDKTGLSAATVLAEMTVLEIKGFVSQEGGKRFSLNLINK